ncbi:hypothetical protein N431DRAFT_105753 [Stipitochalara longipes BDJ]|nr:hypothetical protein N431DRAFT_105753 [Stipitochalara longipes BDJ]
MQRQPEPLLNQPPRGPSTADRQLKYSIYSARSRCIAPRSIHNPPHFFNCCPRKAHIRQYFAASVSFLAWVAPILERSTGAHPLLAIHLESHTARFRSCTMAMIDLASAPHQWQLETSPSPRVLFEQVKAFYANPSPAIVQQSPRYRLWQNVIRYGSVNDVGWRIHPQPLPSISRLDAIGATVSSFHEVLQNTT